MAGRRAMRVGHEVIRGQGIMGSGLSTTAKTLTPTGANEPVPEGVVPVSCDVSRGGVVGDFGARGPR